MNIVVFDTETTGLEKPYCYDIGYVIIDTETKEVLLKRSYVVEQIWHNLALFNTAYYSDKREIYVNRMRARNVKLEKFGYITQQMYRDFKNYEVVGAYAYNSSFDERVFNFNCDWFHCINPFDDIPIFDIRGYAHYFIVNEDYMEWADKVQAFSESGNYSTTAESVYRYISKDNTFIESHTALEDSIIESDILIRCYENGAVLNTDYKAKKSIVRKTEKILTIKDKERILAEFSCYGYSIYKKTNTIILK